MLDFGFSEILLTSAIALVVLGPERLPKVARQVGNWMGRARAMARQLSEQLEREVSADDLLKAKTKFENDLMAPLPKRIGPAYSQPEIAAPVDGAHAEYNPPEARPAEPLAEVSAGPAVAAEHPPAHDRAGDPARTVSAGTVSVSTSPHE